MPTVKLSIGVTSVQSAKPTYAYGSDLAQVPLKSAAALALFRATIPTTIPKDATITSAKVWVNQYDGPWAGSVTLTLLRHLAAYTYKTTWNTNPAATTSGSQTRSGAADDSWWTIDVTTDVQNFVSGSQTNYGWRLATSSTTLHNIRSHKAAASQPYLEISYTLASKVPTNLSPQGGAVSIAKPMLTFTTGDGTTAINVQVDPASNPGTAFDSGTVAATSGLLDLNATAYAGLANGSTTFWRARAQTSAGWSPWSAWVSFSRSNLSSLSLSAPTTTPADGSPPFLWTFAGTQGSWEASLLDSGGKVVDTSGRVAGSETGWTPRKGLATNGSTGTARIRVWDSTLRVATPGAPTYSEATVSFTVTLSGAVTAMTTLTAAQTQPSPAVVVAGTRTTGGIPDEVIVYRNGVQVDRVNGTDIFTSSTAFSYTDWTAPAGVSATYRLAPVVSGSVASGGPSATLTPSFGGIWLADPTTNTAAVLWGMDEGSWDATDLATVHQPIGTGSSIVRRRLRRGVLSGNISGDVNDVPNFAATTTLTALETFASNDAGNTYRLIAGHINVEVVAGDFLVTPTPVSRTTHVRAKASFNFWSD